MNGALGSKVPTRILIALGIFLAALVVFWAGTAVGYREAVYSDDWDVSYMHQFGGPHSPLIFGMDGDDTAMNSHGAFGQVIAVRLPEFTVKGPSEAEKNVIVGGGTIIRKFHSIASTSDLSVGETVVVIGEPDSQGRIQAELVRIVPAPMNGSVQASGTPQI